MVIVTTVAGFEAVGFEVEAEGVETGAAAGVETGGATVGTGVATGAGVVMLTFAVGAGEVWLFGPSVQALSTMRTETRKTGSSSFFFMLVPSLLYFLL